MDPLKKLYEDRERMINALKEAMKYKVTNDVYMYPTIINDRIYIMQKWLTISEVKERNERINKRIERIEKINSNYGEN